MDTNTVGLIVAGVLSDAVRPRKPFMLVGGIRAVVVTASFLEQARTSPAGGRWSRSPERCRCAWSPPVPSPALLAELGKLKQAAAVSPEQWRF